MINNLFPISKLGFKHIGTTLVLSIIFKIFDFDFLALLSIISFLGLVYIYRNPEREIPSFLEGSVVSPSDGTVISIEEIKDSIYAYKVEIESSLCDVSVLRTPMDSSVDSMKIVKGTRVSKDDLLYNYTNEYAIIELSDKVTNKIKIVHRVKQSFVSISLDIIKGQKLRQTQRYGNLVNGVTTVYIPQNFRLSINLGNELKASETLLGYFS